jgi:hypothetical protein
MGRHGDLLIELMMWLMLQVSAVVEALNEIRGLWMLSVADE